MINKKKGIATLAAAFVAMSLVNPVGANASTDISVGLANPVTHVADVQTVSSSTTVAELRNLFVGTLGAGVAKHSLTLNGKKLADTATLAAAGVNDGNWLGVGSAIGGLNVEAYRINDPHPTDANLTSKCSGPNVPTTVGTVNFQWGDGTVLGCADNFVLAKFKGYVGFPTDRLVQFCSGGDDGNRVLIDDQLVTNSWNLQAWGGDCGIVEFNANESKKFEYDYYEWGGGAIAALNYSYSEDGGATWTSPRNVPTSAFINGSNWADDSANVVTGIDGGSHKLTSAGRTAVENWYNSVGNQTNIIKLVGNTDNNSADLARIELASVRNYLKKLGYTGKFQLVAHNGDKGNSDNGNVDEVILVASTTGAADFWAASGPGDVAVDHNRAQFSWNGVGTVTHVTSVRKSVKTVTVTSTIDNSADNSVNRGSLPDTYTINVSLRDANDNEVASNSFTSNEIHRARAVSVTVNYSGYVDHVVTAVSGMDAGFWAGYYGPVVYGAGVKTTN